MSMPKAIRYDDPDALRKAVLERARTEWRALTGRDWTSRDANQFDNPEISPCEAEAIELTSSLKDSLARAARFHRDYADQLKRRDTYQQAAQMLLHFIEYRLRFLIETPGVVRALNHTPSRWTIETRSRVVVLLSSVGYWRHFGLSAVANNRQMAFASLLCGQYPKLNPAKIRKGMTVAEVLQEEIKALRAARSRLRRRFSIKV